jgi:hypothetical protein
MKSVKETYPVGIKSLMTSYTACALALPAPKRFSAYGEGPVHARKVCILNLGNWGF